jgi:uncharacterized protein YdaU (DUF1376 family)
MAYTRMIRHYYRKEAPLPGDLDAVCHAIGARSTEQKAAVATVLRDFFVLHDDGLYHQDKCDAVLAAYHAGQPERDAKKNNEELRIKNHRKERSDLFRILNGAGLHLPYNCAIADLRAAVNDVKNRTVKEAPRPTVESYVDGHGEPDDSYKSAPSYMPGVTGNVAGALQVDPGFPSENGQPATPVTAPATAPATPATATHPPFPTPHYPVEDPSDPPLAGGVPSAPAPAAKARPARKTATDKPVPITGAAWDSYAAAFTRRYGVPPERNQVVNGQLATLARSVSQEELPLVIAFYVQHKTARLYLEHHHPINLFVRDYHGIRTHWAQVTQGVAGAGAAPASAAPTARATRVARFAGHAAAGAQDMPPEPPLTGPAIAAVRTRGADITEVEYRDVPPKP